MAVPPAETAASSVELFTNANFSTGNFTGWTHSGSYLSVDQANPHTSGGYDVDFYAGFGGCSSNYFKQGWTNNTGYTLPAEGVGLVHLVVTMWVATDSSFNGGLELYCSDSTLDQPPIGRTYVIGGGLSYQQISVDCYANPSTVVFVFGVDPFYTLPTAGHAYVSDTQLTVFQPPVVATWLNYPNYGLQWSDKSQIIKLHAYVTPPCSSSSCKARYPIISLHSFAPIRPARMC